MAGPLGCAQEYTVIVVGRGGSPNRGTLEFSELSWGRVLDDTSTAVVTIPHSGMIECCELLGATRSWCDELAIYRDGEKVWEGPIVRVDYGRDDTVLTARDVTAWLFKRKIRTALAFTATDLSTIASAVLADALAVDDPGILTYLTVTPSGVTGDRSYLANSAYAGDEVQELARTGIDYTAIGRRIVVGPETSLADVGTLTDDHLIGDIRVIEDGNAAASSATVVGKGVVATSGGTGPCGLLEVIVNEEQIMDQVSAQAEADAIVAAGSPTPVYLDVPDGAQLAVDAPMGINDLVPGVTVGVASRASCRPLTATLRLQRLSVRFSSGTGEAVGVTLVPVGIDRT